MPLYISTTLFENCTFRMPIFSTLDGDLRLFATPFFFYFIGSKIIVKLDLLWIPTMHVGHLHIVDNMDISLWTKHWRGIPVSPAGVLWVMRDNVMYICCLALPTSQPRCCDLVLDTPIPYAQRFVHPDGDRSGLTVSGYLVMAALVVYFSCQSIIKV